jgi:hypothetical protein
MPPQSGETAGSAAPISQSVEAIGAPPTRAAHSPCLTVIFDPYCAATIGTSLVYGQTGLMFLESDE